MLVVCGRVLHSGSPAVIWRSGKLISKAINMRVVLLLVGSSIIAEIF